MNSKTNVACNRVINAMADLDRVMHEVIPAIIDDQNIDVDVRMIAVMELTRIIDKYQTFQDGMAEALRTLGDDE